MKRLFRRLKEKIKFNQDLPPPYRENDNPVRDNLELDNLASSASLEVIDLLQNCNITPEAPDQVDSEVEYAEITEMGVWHSTPLSHRHKSKVSLTWILKENLENKKPQPTTIPEIDRYRQKYSGIERQRKCIRELHKETKDRVVGRNEYYHNLKLRSACDLVSQESCSEDASDRHGEEWRRRHRHRHRRRKRSRHNGRFGYDIRDLDSFLSEATIDRPGNIPVVVAYPTSLYQTARGQQRELRLPLGTVVNAVFKNQQWLYAQTPHGDEGYVMYSACLPLGILPSRSPQKKTPCWESSTDIYPRPCGNLTDNEKEQLRGRAKSECRYRPKSDKRQDAKSSAEEEFDTLYLKTRSASRDRKEQYKTKIPSLERQMLLVVNSDFKGSPLNRTLSVRKDDVVVLAGDTGVDCDWFYVKKKDGSQGFIPAEVAGHGFI